MRSISAGLEHSANIVRVLPALILSVCLAACAAPPDTVDHSMPSTTAPTSIAGETAPSAIESSAAPPEPVPRLEPFPGVTVDVATRTVELQAIVCLDQGWLEQIACAPGSREHESLVVPQATPSQVHASLLLAGYEPGAPGSWTWDGSDVQFTPPRGDPLEVRIRYDDVHGAVGSEPVDVPIRAWIIDHTGANSFPHAPWIFCGSRVETNPEWMGPGEHYVADMTGSIIGLVTFSDEVIGYARVLADQEAVQAPQWEANTLSIPPIGTEVTLVLTPWKE